KMRASAGGGGIPKISRDINSGSPPGEKLAEQGSTLGLPNTGKHFDPMVQARIGQDVVNGPGGTRLRIRSSEHEPRNPSLNHGAGAHHTGFDRRVHRDRREPVVSH